jgi:exodeoxyribonuclease V alpha subunit
MNPATSTSPNNKATLNVEAPTASLIGTLVESGVIDSADARLIGWFGARVTASQRDDEGKASPNPDDAGTVLTIVAATLCRACASGSLCLPLARPGLAAAVRETYLALDPAADADESDAAAGRCAGRFLALVDSGFYDSLVGTTDVSRPLVRAVGNLYLHRYWFAVRTIADRLRAHAALPAAANEESLAPVFRTILQDAPLRTHDGAPLILTAAQNAALTRSLSSSVFVLAGGPGTGKTTWTAAWLRAVLRLPGVTPERVRICAPTGRAARRLEESLQGALAGCLTDPRDAEAAELKVTTLHTLLGWRAFEGRFARCAEDPLDADWLLLDEASMADVFLLSALVKALRPGTRIVLAGDPGQLPAVEAGAVLGELLPAFDGGPSPLPSVTLDVSHRATGAVIPLAAAVRRGDADAVVELFGGPTAPLEAFSPGRDLARLEPSADTMSSVRAALHAFAAATFNSGHGARATNGYAGLLTRFRTLTREHEASALDHLWKHAGRARVLAPLRRGPVSAERANFILRQKLEPEWRQDRDTPGIGFHGAPILVTRNDARTGLSNGDLGLWLETAEGAMVFFPRPELPGGWLRLPVALLPVCELGFASTVHKSQGSECDEVLILLPEAGNRLLARETIYTAITRARKSVRIYGSEVALREAVGRTLRRPGGMRELLAEPWEP